MRHQNAIGWSLETNHQRGPSMTRITTIGLDLAKSVFQVPSAARQSGVRCIASEQPDRKHRGIRREASRGCGGAHGMM